MEREESRLDRNQLKMFLFCFRLWIKDQTLAENKKTATTVNSIGMVNNRNPLPQDFLNRFLCLTEANL